MSESAGGAHVRQVVIVSRVKRNPYVQLLCEGLAQPGLGLAPRISDEFSLKWLWRQRRALDVLHVHWLELLFSYPTLWWSVKRWLSVIGALVLAKAQGVSIVYTVHNVWQHEGRRLRLTRWANRIMFRLADAVHVHDHGTAEALAQYWGRTRAVHVIPHGNYMTAYSNTRTRAQARQRLGLAEDAYVFCFLGRIRPYKGLEDLLQAFAGLAAEQAVLLIAGEAQEERFAHALAAQADADARIRFINGFVPDDDLQDYLNGSDVCVLPYRHVTTSGAAILCFSFGTPIIAPRMGCFVELVGEDERGLLYEPGDVSDLRQALAQSMTSDQRLWRSASQAFARRLDWKHIAQQHATMYDKPEQDIKR